MGEKLMLWFVIFVPVVSFNKGYIEHNHVMNDRTVPIEIPTIMLLTTYQGFSFFTTAKCVRIKLCLNPGRTRYS